jgi:pimeloyl-ACP methyl ester carboxylesterase
MNPYDYSRGGPDVTLALRKANSKWSRSSVKFASAAPAARDESSIVEGEYFRPLRASNAPLAIILHGLGDHTVFPCKLLARSLVSRGIACLLLYTVFHSSRMPESMKIRMPVLTCEEWFEGYRTSVIEIRQAVDWAITRPEINPEQIAVVGMSLGGFAAAIAMAVEERLRAGVFITMGGDAIITGWESKADTFRKGYNCSEEECRKVHAQYPRYLARVIEEGLENVAPLKQCFLSDTLTYGHRLKDRPVLMINARWDKYIPREAAVRFWQECGRPSIIWLPTGHVTIWGLYPVISRNVARFLGSAFKPQGQQSPKCGQLTRM